GDGGAGPWLLRAAPRGEPVGPRADGVPRPVAPLRPGGGRGGSRLPLLRSRADRACHHGAKNGRGGGAGDPGLVERVVPALRSTLVKSRGTGGHRDLARGADPPGRSVQGRGARVEPGRVSR